VHIARFGFEADRDDRAGWLQWSGRRAPRLD
jgi:hypothetical protein